MATREQREAERQARIRAEWERTPKVNRADEFRRRQGWNTEADRRTRDRYSNQRNQQNSTR